LAKKHTSLSTKTTDEVTSKQFKDSLSGVYGGFDMKVFEKHKKALFAMQN
jgi:hypothetical protein